MAEGRPTSSSGQPAKPKSSQSEERPHHISEAEGREAETPALQLSGAQQEPPAAALHLDTASTSPEEGSQVTLTSDQQQGSDQSQSHSSSASSPLPLPITYVRVSLPGWREPTTKIFRSGCSVTVATLYPGRHSLESSSVVALPDEPLHMPPTDRPRSEPVLGSEGEVVVHGRIQPTMQRPMSSLSAKKARQVASQLNQGPSFLQTGPAPRITAEVSQ